MKVWKFLYVALFTFAACSGQEDVDVPGDIHRDVYEIVADTGFDAPLVDVSIDSYPDIADEVTSPDPGQDMYTPPTDVTTVDIAGDLPENDAACAGQCDSRECGDDGCGHSCGDCAASSCNDNLWTPAGQCVDGTCLTSPGTSCDDENPCTNDSCDPFAGCTHTNEIDVGCDDQDACTTGDVCAGGICFGEWDGATCGCVFDLDCRAETHCDETSGVCVENLAVDSPCIVDADCVVETHCDETSGICVADSAVDEACQFDDDCGTQAFCNASTSSCSALSGIGMPCSVDRECADDLHCDEAGQTCTFNGTSGAGCLFDGDCADGFHCDKISTSCAADGADGAACSANSDCARAYHCSSGSCLIDGRPGDLCETVDDCAEGLECRADDSSVWVCRRPVGAGGACVGSADCGQEYHCQPGTLVCVADGGADAECQAKDDCASGYYCNESSLTCQAELAAGAPCASTFQCAGDAYCAPSTDTCTRPGVLASPCNGDWQCSTGYHCDETTPACTPDIGAGGDCTDDDACGDGYACDGVTSKCIALPERPHCADEILEAEPGFFLCTGVPAPSDTAGLALRINWPEGVDREQIPDIPAPVINGKVWFLVPLILEGDHQAYSGDLQIEVRDRDVLLATIDRHVLPLTIDSDGEPGTLWLEDIEATRDLLNSVAPPGTFADAEDILDLTKQLIIEARAGEVLLGNFQVDETTTSPVTLDSDDLRLMDAYLRNTNLSRSLAHAGRGPRLWPFEEGSWNVNGITRFARLFGGALLVAGAVGAGASVATVGVVVLDAAIGIRVLDEVWTYWRENGEIPTEITYSPIKEAGEDLGRLIGRMLCINQTVCAISASIADTIVDVRCKPEQKGCGSNCVAIETLCCQRSACLETVKCETSDLVTLGVRCDPTWGCQSTGEKDRKYCGQLFNGNGSCRPITESPGYACYDTCEGVPACVPAVTKACYNDFTLIEIQMGCLHGHCAGLSETYRDCHVEYGGTGICKEPTPGYGDCFPPP